MTARHEATGFSGGGEPPDSHGKDRRRPFVFLGGLRGLSFRVTHQQLMQPADGAAPGQTACLYAGDVVVGYGTIA